MRNYIAALIACTSFGLCVAIISCKDPVATVVVPDASQSFGDSEVDVDAAQDVTALADDATAVLAQDVTNTED